MLLRALTLIAVLFGTNAAFAEDKYEEVDPKGMPTGYKVGLSSRYVIWYDAAGWHLRVTTASALTDFKGKIEAIDGKIVSMKLISGTGTKKGDISPEFKTESKSIELSNKISKGIQSGYDFKLDDKATGIKFDLQVDGKEQAAMIFIGAKGVHPKGSVVVFPAKPGKK